MRIILMLVTIFVAIAGTAQAQAVSNTMDCKKAVAYYEKNGRINTTTRSGATVPIYGGVPASQRARMSCMTMPIMVRTADDPSCPIAYKCLPRIGR